MQTIELRDDRSWMAHYSSVQRMWLLSFQKIFQISICLNGFLLCPSLFKRELYRRVDSSSVDCAHTWPLPSFIELLPAIVLHVLTDNDFQSCSWVYKISMTESYMFFNVVPQEDLETTFALMIYTVNHDIFQVFKFPQWERLFRSCLTIYRWISFLGCWSWFPECVLKKNCHALHSLPSSLHD